MTNNPNQPRKDDAVLGGQSPPPVEGVVLGGIEGVKSRLASAVVEARIAALSEALHYGDTGLDLVIGALKDESEQVQHSASLLLKNSPNPQAKQALFDYDPWLFFTTLENWKLEEFDPEIGIADPMGTAYGVSAGNIDKLLEDPQISNFEALVCEYHYYRSGHKDDFAEILSDASAKLTRLKAIFIGDVDMVDELGGYKASRIELSEDYSYLLAAYPNLEVLQLRGKDDMEFSPLQHNYLKTLIIETGGLSKDTLAQICTLKLPRLEYLELWLGSERSFYGCGDSFIDDVMPIIGGVAFPELKYLGLCSSDYSDYIALAVARSPFIRKLKILNLSKGNLTDVGAEALLNCPAINHLHTLNLTMNLLSPTMIERLSHLNCQVMAQSQDEEYEIYSSRSRYETYPVGIERYFALFE
ncbi:MULTISPECIES: HEAT repeat domain-containing protein [unclassified Coleofasciculus]|uniref:HEAT repeat domain-containing protein n=1 Tax=unclassified Coleofasciculus TaxID=2692782 RepID=UPI0018824CF4|nr:MULTISPECIES: HEAT repeat domain-containing protein [unclassified Coleofasciculus]MBE9128463.1 HEAT repeat domain-containing protein [Coleofasciculus sp. LEGE 07081]MBE9149278.1 HEAT repeat domain-containing protein [Coleofasciculus sp. LEGE 07092]